MSFESLIDKVHQAETALEAKERQTGADWRQCKASWVSLWTPGRIVSVGLVSGFIVGKVEPTKRMVRGSGALQMLSAVAGLFAGGSAQAAAGHAKQAADSAEQTVAVAAPDTVTDADALAAAAATATATAQSKQQPPSPSVESLRKAGLL